MVKKKSTTEVELKLKELRDYCEENNIPFFGATWSEPTIKRDDGYTYEYVSPLRLGIDIEGYTNERDRFPLFLGAILGFDRNNYKA